MFAQIVVKTKIPSIGKTYTYRIPDELMPNAEAGKIVEVPFGNKILEGVIFSLTPIAPEFKVKEIIRITPDPPILAAQSLALAMWISRRYSANFFECLQGMLPKTTLKSAMRKKELPAPAHLEEDLKLNEEQQVAFDTIKNTLHPDISKQFLLFGVTGSGKTEIYLQLTRLMLNEGKQVLFMVPEISLTPQLIDRFSKRFGKDLIAIVHSYTTSSQKADAWENIRSNKKKIVIGSRSAILSPFADLGMIIIDECHEQSYKQDKNPKYNAIELARYLSRTEDVPLVLGSATPLVEQYFEAKQGSLQLLHLSQRISGHLPINILVDVRKGDKKSYSLISERLANELMLVTTKSEQALLYLNRRGIRSGLICTKCGKYEECPKCSMPLTIHNKQGQDILVCHYCFFTKPIISQCTHCGSRFIRATGSGTHSIMQEVHQLLPQSNVIIMDKDSTIKKGSHDAIFRQFEKGEADVLIGTQMVTKGWDIANVTLTGYLLLDSDLIFPSFRTPERVYQLITQLAGRAGRGTTAGVNIIQTYNPQNEILQDALNGNYQDFFDKQIALRSKLLYPPFVHLVQIVAKDKKEHLALSRLRGYLSTVTKPLKQDLSGHTVSLLGPSRCFIPKVNNEYFFQGTLKIKIAPQDARQEVFEKVLDSINTTKRPTGIGVNIDPFDLE